MCLAFSLVASNLVLEPILVGAVSTQEKLESQEQPKEEFPTIMDTPDEVEDDAPLVEEGEPTEDEVVDEELVVDEENKEDVIEEELETSEDVIEEPVDEVVKLPEVVEQEEVEKLEPLVLQTSKVSNPQFRKDVRILEVQPGLEFAIAAKSKTSETETVKVSNITYSIILDKVTMAEFISQIDKINGKYDIVVVGNYNSKYTAQFMNGKPNYLPWGREKKNGFKNDSKLSVTGKTSIFNNKTYVEYYSENDITDKRAKEIIFMINSGQLVYMDKDIFSDNNLKTSKLHTNFQGLSGDNFIKTENVEASNFNLSKIINKYHTLEARKKRPILNITSKPDENNTSNNLKYEVEIGAGVVGDLELNLYLDVNGDGLFKEDERKESMVINLSNANELQKFTFNYQLPDNYIGYLDWKVEVVRRVNKDDQNSYPSFNNVINYALGHCVFNLKQGAGKQNVRVLQIDPGTNLDLTKGDFKKFADELETYKLTVIKKSVNTVKDEIIKFKSTNPTKNYFNENYDMIVLGFADSFGGKDFTQNMANELLEYIETEKGVMFTHDTFTYRIMDKSLMDNKPGDASRLLTQQFRTILGQARYASEIFDLEGYDYYEALKATDKDKVTFGMVDPLLKKYQSKPDNGSYDKTLSSIHKINEGLITSYPYSLGDISVATTHHQWYQLNLEDPDVVPWYTLNYGSNAVESLNARNYYYTYSKGNITYSGAGHSNGYKSDELKLFINTMIKAVRGANNPPVIASTLSPVSEISLDQKVQFDTWATDLDEDDVIVTVTVDGKSNNIKLNGQRINTIQTKQGEPIAVELGEELFNNIKDYVVKIEAKDIKGASAEAKTYIIRPTKDPKVMAVSNGNEGLVGDELNVSVQLSKIDDELNKISNVKLAVSKQVSNQQFEIKNFNGSQIDLGSNSKNISFTVKTSNEVNSMVELDLTYDVSGKPIQEPIKVFVPVKTKRGQIKVKVIDELGRPLTVDTLAMIESNKGYNSSEVIVGNGTGMLTWPLLTGESITSGDYKVKIEQQVGYEVKSYITNRMKENGLIQGNGVETVNIPLSYGEPILEVTFEVEKNEKIVNLNILEIQPADSFKITTRTDLNYIQTGSETRTVIKDDIIYEVKIDHISMPEYLGKVDKVNGKYDVIVLGRTVDNNNMSGDQQAYKDYGKRNQSSLAINNDISNRKADELVQFIETRQLVFLDEALITTNSEFQNSSELYKHFSPYYTNKLNNVRVDKKISDLTLGNIIDEYTSVDEKFKNADFSIESYPLGDPLDATVGVRENRNFEFNIKFMTAQQTPLTVSLYLDIDGDGLYSDKEKVKTVTTSSQIALLQYEMPDDFIGYLDWKLETVKENNIKSYQTGNLKLTSLDGKTYPIKVLQVAPYGTNDLKDKISGNLNLSSVEKGGNKRFNELLKQLIDYDIQIEVMSIYEFNDKAGKTLNLNENYDMVILGFGDCYGLSCNQNTDFNDTSANELLKFISTGQAVMFTHDTLWSGSSPNRIRIFRELAGQTNLDAFATKNGWQNSQTKTIYQINDALITNYPFKLDETINIRRTHGQWYQLDMENENVIPWYMDTPNTVRTNGSNPDYDYSQVPQDVIEELQQNGLTVENMKNDDQDNRSNTNLINPYDVKNNYYTYSNKNITFSGTAENTKEKNSPYPQAELMLFINTIAKAVRGANHKPVISVSNLYDKMEVSKNSESFDFIATATDIDNDQIEVVISISNPDGSNSVELKKVTINSGDPIPVSVSKNVFDYTKMDQVVLTVTAKDIGTDDNPKGATDTKSYTVFPTNMAMLAQPVVTGNKSLVGDLMNVTVALKIENEGDQTIGNVRLELTDNFNTNAIKVDLGKFTNPSVIEMNQGSGNITIPVTTFIPLNGDNSSQIKGKIYYDVKTIGTNATVSKEIPIDIPLYSKEGVIEVEVTDGSGLGLADDLKQLLLVELTKGSEVLQPINLNQNGIALYKNLKTSEYSVKLNLEKEVDVSSLLANYEIIEKIISGSNEDGLFRLNYDNPTVKVAYKVDTYKLIHGLYQGFNQEGLISDDKIKILESSDNPKEMVQGATTTFGATFNVYKDTLAILDVDQALELKGPIKLYVLNGEKLDLINTIETKAQDKTYTIELSEIVPGSKILILYQGALNEPEKIYKNEIKVSKFIKDVSVKTKKSDQNLPDLF